MNDQIYKLEEKVEKHENRITNLEITDATIMQQVRDLVKSVDGLVSTMKWLLGIIVTISIGLLGIYFK
ncbi:hemolysin XhlA family protein [Clostridium gasigenes]|uniref:hemolysin XhlA family protein n=1 Tax=Clostridium gasigenes TaxID=94869 RepID=UPI00143860E4|nr:hemolysin XhlA family protein [Clostridium gasigenes]NKF05309.1 hypothetical protein [Clostridium gasigenes]QSW18763.1 hemolysin XhlA family protein [Clostridium gasigenes]